MMQSGLIADTHHAELQGRGAALFASFLATTAGSGFPRSFIIGYRFSLPDADQKRDCPGRTPDLPSSDAILLRVICSSTPAGRTWPRLAALSVLRSTLCTVSAPATYPLRGSITHPTQPLCTLRGRRRRRLTQHSLPGCLLSITWVGLSPTDRASFAWRLRRVGPSPDSGGAAIVIENSYQRRFAPFRFAPRWARLPIGRRNHFLALKCRKSGGGWSFLIGIKLPSAPSIYCSLPMNTSLRSSVQLFSV